MKSVKFPSSEIMELGAMLLFVNHEERLGLCLIHLVQFSVKKSLYKHLAGSPINAFPFLTMKNFGRYGLSGFMSLTGALTSPASLSTCWFIVSMSLNLSASRA